MSFEATRWAWDQDIDKPSAKYVLLALADMADSETASCNPSKEYLAEKTTLTTRSLRTWLAWLEDMDLIKIEAVNRRDGSDSSNRYILPAEEVARYRGGGEKSARGGEKYSPPYTEPVLTTNGVNDPEIGTTPETAPRVKIGTDRLNAEEWDQAQAIIGTFNAEMGTKFQLLSSRGRPTDHLKRIVMRVRENPEVTLGEHVEMIKRQAKPAPEGHWWGEGKPSAVAVLYGEGSFPRCLATDDGARSRPKHRRTFAWERSLKGAKW